MPQLESSVPNKASPLQGRETAVQPAAGSKISGSENNARIASGSKVLEHARKSQVTKCQEHVVVPVIKAPVGGVVSNSPHPAAFDLPPIQEHSIPMSIPEDEEKPVSGQSEPEATPPASPQPKAHRPHRERSLCPGDSPQNKSSASKKKQVTQEVPLKPIVDVAATSGAAPGTKPTQNPTGKPPRQKSKPFAEEPQVDEATEPSLVSKFKVQNRFIDSVAANPGNTLMILKWLSGNYEPMDLDPEGSESESMTVQRLRFHHIETLEGIKAADWQHIQESGEVAYRLFHELLELEADSLRKGGSPNQVCNSDSEMAEDRCTKLFRYIGVLEQHEKVFSAQMKTVAHFLMASILRKKGHNVEARFYTAQIWRFDDYVMAVHGLKVPSPNVTNDGGMKPKVSNIDRKLSI
ncbi:hypothetical protein TWF173_009860 [Orbilia oligospora]|nr:hypothetical protein TWF173_009860 [Orbilia oligospora]